MKKGRNGSEPQVDSQSAGSVSDKLEECLHEIKTCLNAWYPLAQCDDDEEDIVARKRLWDFYQRIKPNAEMSLQGSERTL